MRVIHFVLVISLLLMLSCASVAQMDQQQMDQNQQMDQGQMMPNATVQQGPVVRAGLPPSVDVFVNGRYAMRIAAPAGGMSPMQRAQIIANRMNQAFAEGMTWQDMRVGQVGNNWVVAAGNMPIATADTRSARAFGLSPGMLASRWASQSVVALGGQPQMIAMQLQPIPTQVAGAVQEVGAVNWTTSQTKIVPLLDVSTGNQLGMVTVAGSQNQLNNVDSVVLYTATSDGSTVYTFVPISGTSVTGTVSRVMGVGIVGVPSGWVPTGMMMGDDAMRMVTQMGTQWNASINAALTQNNLQIRGNTKVVPLYSMDTNQVIGAAQVVGNASDLAQTQAVLASSRDNMLMLRATSTQCTPMMGEPETVNNVVVSSLVFASAGATQPATVAPETTPSETTPPGPPETTPSSPTAPEITPSTPYP